MKLTIDDKVMKTTTSFEIVSHEKALVTLEPGCVWSYLKEDNEKVGIAFAGPSRFAVDAIMETEYGAKGESISGNLSGIQVFIGRSNLESASDSASNNQLAQAGFKDEAAFKDAVETKLYDMNSGKGKIELSKSSDSVVFLGQDEGEKKIVLVAKEDKLVFTYDKMVFTLGGDSMVSVTKSGVVIRGRDCQDLVIDRHGISGLEELRSIGPTVQKAVSEAMRGIKKFKDVRIVADRFPRAWDNVDDFDWDD
ncbi:MAG: hypothetical protein ACW97A_03255 [Candidatus Thorarchaeota archaeon]